MASRSRTAALLALTIAALLLSGCASPSPAAQPAQTETTAAPAHTATKQVTSEPTADPAGLVPAVHAQCNAGEKILQYLADGNNHGDPQLDQRFAQYVGVPAPQARSIADQYIQQCDAALSKQAADQASAEAQARAEASASAAAAQKEAAYQSAVVKTCASIGGHYDTHWLWCASDVTGNPSGRPGADCTNANVALNSDGSLAGWDYSTTKDNYPGCFK